jgi:hypothetical protein
MGHNIRARVSRLEKRKRAEEFHPADFCPECWNRPVAGPVESGQPPPRCPRCGRRPDKDPAAVIRRYILAFTTGRRAPGHTPASAPPVGPVGSCGQAGAVRAPGQPPQAAPELRQCDRCGAPAPRRQERGHGSTDSR